MEIKLTHILYAEPAKVFSALTDAKQIEKWSGGKAEFGKQPGEAFYMFDEWVSGEILSIVTSKEISYSWKPNTWSKKTPASIVKIILKKHEAGTALVLTHSNFPSEKELESHKSGWVDNVFEPLNDFLI